MLAGLRIGFESGEKCCVTSRRDVLGGRPNMSMNIHAAFETEFDAIAVEPQSSAGRWVETALTALCTASAVLFVSFIAVVTGLV
jgi:hypothetical protein